MQYILTFYNLNGDAVTRESRVFADDAGAIEYAAAALHRINLTSRIDLHCDGREVRIFRR